MATQTTPVVASDWKKMKVQELRDELTSRGLDTSGVKSTLVERLEAAATTKVEGDATDPAEAGGRKEMDLDINEGAPIDQVDEKQTAIEPVTTEPPVVAEDMAAEALPVANNAPPLDKVEEITTAPPAEAPATVTNGTAVAVPSTDLEKKQRRAERFGLELMVSEGEKRRLRAARFGDAVGTKTNGAAKDSSQDESSKMSPTLKDAEAIKRKARAARFGIEEVGEKGVSSPTGADDAKKKARLARFGAEIKLDPQEQEKKKLRAARFGLTAEAKPEVEPEKKVTVEQSVAT